MLKASDPASHAHDRRCLDALLRIRRPYRQHQCAAQIPAGRHVLLGDQVHPVAVRRDEHDVGRPVERRELLAVYTLHVGEELFEIGVGASIDGFVAALLAMTVVTVPAGTR